MHRRKRRKSVRHLQYLLGVPTCVPVPDFRSAHLSSSPWPARSLVGSSDPRRCAQLSRRANAGPNTGQPRRRLWWWLVPLLRGVAALQVVPLHGAWEAVVPCLDEPAKYRFAELLDSDARKEALKGAW